METIEYDPNQNYIRLWYYLNPVSLGGHKGQMESSTKVYT